MIDSMGVSEKVPRSGRVVAVQPRIRLIRSFDERSHSYLGYVLRIDGTCGGQADEFLIAVGEAAHEKHQFQEGKETAAFYKTSWLKVLKDAEGDTPAGPPFHGVPP
jgi:hypothetical protein